MMIMNDHILPKSFAYFFALLVLHSLTQLEECWVQEIGFFGDGSGILGLFFLPFKSVIPQSVSRAGSACGSVQMVPPLRKVHNR